MRRSTSPIIERFPLALDHEALKKLRRKFTPKVLRYIGERSRKLTVESIRYRSDGLRVKGFLIQPKRGTKLPCIIYNRGGNGSYGQIDPTRLWGFLTRIAAWGYVVIASQYRGNGGGEGREDFGGEDVHDILNLLRCLESIPKADTSRIGMYGWSRGGLKTLRALSKTKRVRAAAVGGTPTDLVIASKERPKMLSEVYRKLIPGHGRKFTAELKKRSALYWPERLPTTTPLLILHGTADWRVLPHHSVDLARELLRLRRPFRLVLFEGGDHGLTENFEEVNSLTRAWFDRFVRDRGRLPNLRPHGR